MLSEISQIGAREDLQVGGDVSCQPNVSDRRNVTTVAVRTVQCRMSYQPNVNDRRNVTSTVAVGSVQCSTTEYIM